MTTAIGTRHAGRLARLVLAFFLGVAALAPARADLDVNGTRQALAALGQLQRNLQDLQAAAGVPLGPYPVQTQCTWCSEHAWWGLGMCTQNTTQRYNASVDFNWMRERLVGVLNAAQAQTASFSTSYAPAQAWLRGIPGFNGAFQSAADTMLKVRDEIKAGQGPSDEQRQRVTAALQTVVGGLGSSRQQLAAGTQALTVYMQAQSNFRQQIGATIQGSDQSARDALTSFQNQTRTWRCQDGLDGRFTQIRGDFSGSMQRISASFQSLDASSRAAEQALAVMTGTLVSAQGDYQSILDKLQAAQNDQLGSFIEQLHLDAAKRQWQQLADYAVQVQ